ncbi:MAG: phospholipase D-like domain-containing protein [Burkholderiaceae bacterium]
MDTAHVDVTPRRRRRRRARKLLPWAGGAVVLVWALSACISAPSVPPAAALAVPAASRAAASAARGSPFVKVVARELSVTGPHGRMSQPEREALLRRLSEQGSATLLQRQLAAMSVFGDVDLVAGNRSELLVDGPATFEAMFKVIDKARDRILVESYIVEDAAIAGRLADALMRKRAEGVKVALLYDAVGSIGTDEAFFDKLRGAGVAVCAYNPFGASRQRRTQPLTQRDHRKILVVDGGVGFVGGINLSSVYSSGSFSAHRREARDAGADDVGWRDTNVQLRGPVAARLDQLVRDSWHDQGCDGGLPAAAAPPEQPAAGSDVIRVVDTRPDDDYSRMYAQLMTAFDTAQRSIYLTMAYFAPGDDMVDALCDAARRGVDVQLVLPSRSDFMPVIHAGRARYAQLLDAGVKIHEFQTAILHAKTAVVDGVWSTVGSSNMDYRSFAANNEINVVVLGEDFGNGMQQLFRRDVAASRTITAQEWRERDLGQRVVQGLARLFERWW